MEIRTETCEQCGETWNVSKCAQYYAGVYICPYCDADNRKKGGRYHEGLPVQKKRVLSAGRRVQKSAGAHKGVPGDVQTA